MRWRNDRAMLVNSSQEEGGEPGVWLRLRILNSLVLNFSTTVRAIRDSPYSGQPAHGQRQQKGIYFFGLYEKEPVRLFPVGSNLGEKFVRRYACRCRQIQF